VNAAALTRVAAREESRRTSFVGMVMALASWTMLFVSLFFSYAVLRLGAGEWPPVGLEPLPRLLPFLNTLVLAASSLVLHAGVRPAAAARPGALLSALRRTLALGSLFLALQLAVWIPLWRSGFRIESGVFGSVFYGLTVFHALHVLAGLAALLVLVPGAAKGRWVSGAQSPVRLTAMFWHFVDAVWVLMFVTIYLL
jgi:cytochrome c oxidase subunit 3